MLFESIEIRKVQNGIIVSIKSEEEDDKDYVFPNVPKTLKFVKEYLETKQPS
jgi:hypothetical protein